MEIRVTLLDPANGARADVAVRAAAASPAAELIDGLCAVLADPGAGPVTVEGRPVPVDGSVADAGLVDGDVLVLGAESGPGATHHRPQPRVGLVAVSGPDTGRRIALTDGDCLVGRDPGCRLTIDDPAVSRRHVRLRVDDAAIVVTDLDSANGTRLDGVKLTAGVATALATGEWLDLGDTRLRLDATGEARGLPVGAHRAARTPAAALDGSAPDPVVVEYPAEPTPPPRPRLPILATSAPLAAGVVLAVVLHQWEFLAFTALSPVMMLAQVVSERRAARRAARRAIADYTSGCARADTRLRVALGEERRRRYAQAPDLGELAAAAGERSALLWSRDGNDTDALAVRLGRGDQPSEVSVRGGPAATALDVPACVSLRRVGVLGVCGAREPTTGLIRALVLQVASLHRPGQVRIVVLAPGRAADWAWVRWLPHVAARGESCTALVGFDERQVEARIAELAADCPDAGSDVTTVVVIDGANVALPTALMRRIGSNTGTVCVIRRADRPGELTGRVGALADLVPAPGLRLLLRRADRSGAEEIVPDLVATDVAERIARRLAPLRDVDVDRQHAMPSTVALADLVDVDLRDSDRAVRSLERLWSRSGRTAIPLGRDATGRLDVDLCRDGPHALIAGMTGSGKSELLLSLVAGLAAHHRPDALSLLLIDHKGGATFNRCARLPHAIGVITDLDPQSTGRALLSLTAELRRRERLFADAGVCDFEAYGAAVPVEVNGHRLPRLVIVVDEFATLADEQPDFVDGLVGIAQRGRSLGVHLVLATQRPHGVVSADIRANARLRVCLGVGDAAESLDVIDAPDAAAISASTPGRGFIRVGPGALREFHAARVTTPRGTDAGVQIARLPALSLGDPPWVPEPTAASGPSDLDLLVDAATELSERLRVRTAAAPWLPPLPARLALRELALRELVRREVEPREVEPGELEPEGPAGVSWGLVDLPAEGRQEPLTIDLDVAGTTVIAGGPRSGRTTALRAIAVASAQRRGPDRLHCWALDGGGGLAELERLPHCGGVIPVRDGDRVERLLAHLTSETERRRRAAGDPGPAQLLLVDSWESLMTATGDRDLGQVADRLVRLATEGPAAGLRVVIATDRSGLVGRLAGVASERIALRLPDPADYTLIGVPARELPRELPPGRGVRASDAALVHLALADDDELARAARWTSPRCAVRRFDPLPDRIHLEQIASPAPTAEDLVTFGVGGDDMTPVRLTRRELGGGVLIAGPPGAGRSTALALIGHQLRGRSVAVVGEPDSPLFGVSGAVQLPCDDQDHAVALLDSLYADDAPDLLVDDIDRLPEGPLWDRLEALLRSPLDRSQVIALAGAPDGLATPFRGPIAHARRRQLGLLLCPMGAHDGDLFGVRLPRRSARDDPPGRGWLVSRGTTTRLQLALPQPPSQRNTHGPSVCL